MNWTSSLRFFILLQIVVDPYHSSKLASLPLLLIPVITLDWPFFLQISIVCKLLLIQILLLDKPWHYSLIHMYNIHLWQIKAEPDFSLNRASLQKFLFYHHSLFGSLHIPLLTKLDYHPHLMHFAYSPICSEDDCLWLRYILSPLSESKLWGLWNS